MMLEANKILQGDCLDKLKELEDNSVDSIVTDPPYHLVSIVKRFSGQNARNTPAMNTKEGGVFARKAKGFMGKEWDGVDENGMGIAMNIDMWKECLRVLKPGGHLLAFSGTRTYHRMAVAIEDAGFEVRDMIEWVYGSGFPKSLNIGKAINKIDGVEFDSKPASGVGFMNNDTEDGYHPTINQLVQKGESSDRAKQWEGWGTALKPAHEPICLARKPLSEKTVAENCLKYGTGGINIEESRVPAEPELAKNWDRNAGAGFGNGLLKGGLQTDGFKDNTPSGRFPANLIHDNSEEVRECFPETNGGSAIRKNKLNPYGNDRTWSVSNTPAQETVGYTDSGNASRFFKSIKQDLHCSLCYDTIDTYQLTKNICNNTNVNNVEKSSETTQAITESTALKNATGKVNENLVQNVKSAGNLCDLCGTSIAQRLVAIMQDQSQESTLGELSMPEHKRQILEKCLVSFVELMGNTDTIPTMENLNLLFGYVLNAIEEYTQKCEDTKSEDKNQWKSLIYKSKASKSERNKGLEGFEEKERVRQGLAGEHKNTFSSNFHPTVKPIALMEYLIKMITPKGGVVLDPFAGSGSTLVAAKQNGFNYIGIEREPEYINIINARLQ